MSRIHGPLYAVRQRIHYNERDAWNRRAASFKKAVAEDAADTPKKAEDGCACSFAAEVSASGRQAGIGRLRLPCGEEVSSQDDGRVPLAPAGKLFLTGRVLRVDGAVLVLADVHPDAASAASARLAMNPRTNTFGKGSGSFAAAAGSGTETLEH